MYLKDVDTAFNRPQRNNDGGVRNAQLSVFCQIARSFGEPVRGEAFSKHDMEVAHWFVLNNCDEIILYLDEHEEMMKREYPSQLYSKKHREMFPQWFLEYVSYKYFVFDIKLIPPFTVKSYITWHSAQLALNYSRVAMLTASNFWGLQEMTSCVRKTAVSMSRVEVKVRTLISMANSQLSCNCFTRTDTNVKIDHGLLSVNINKTWYDDDPYILANMAKQIVYLDDPKAGHGWKVVQRMDRRNVYAIPN
ncbi:unnamed protein product [Prunus brigantina]